MFKRAILDYKSREVWVRGCAGAVGFVCERAKDRQKCKEPVSHGRDLIGWRWSQVTATTMHGAEQKEARTGRDGPGRGLNWPSSPGQVDILLVRIRRVGWTWHSELIM